MVSTLSSIGFEIPSADYGRRLMAELARYASRRISSIPGDYAVWRSGSGAELWFHVEGERGLYGHIQEGRVVSFQPFFACEGNVAVTVTQLMQRPDDSDFDGVAAAVATDGGCQVAFNAVDYAVHTRRKLPLEVNAKLLGFARTLSLHASEEAFRAAARGAPLGVKSFAGDRHIAIGGADNDNLPRRGQLVMIDTGKAYVPRTNARLSGVVVQYKTLENEVSERTYHWFLVDGPGGLYDVVADRDLVAETAMPGMIIETEASFSGRFVD